MTFGMRRIIQGKGAQRERGDLEEARLKDEEREKDSPSHESQFPVVAGGR